MFSSSQISNAVENTIRRNNSNVADAEQAKVTLTSLNLVSICIINSSSVSVLESLISPAAPDKTVPLGRVEF